MDRDLFVNERRAAELVSFSAGHLRKLRSMPGKGPAFSKVGGVFRYKVGNVLDWAEGLPTRGHDQPVAFPAKPINDAIAFARAISAQWAARSDFDPGALRSAYDGSVFWVGFLKPGAPEPIASVDCLRVVCAFETFRELEAFAQQVGRQNSGLEDLASSPADLREATQ